MAIGIKTVKLDGQVVDWTNRAIANGGNPSITTQRALSDFVLSCKQDGTWSQLIIVNPVAPDDSGSLVTPLLVGNSSGSWSGLTVNAGASQILSVNGYINNGNSAPIGCIGTAIWTSSVDASVITYVSQDRNGSNNPGQVFNGMAGDDACSTGELDVGWGYSSMWAAYLLWSPAALGYSCLTRTSNTNQNTYFANSSTVHGAVQTDSSNRTQPIAAGNIFVWRSPCRGGGNGTFQGGMSFVAFGYGMTSAQSQNLFNNIQRYRRALGGGFI